MHLPTFTKSTFQVSFYLPFFVLSFNLSIWICGSLAEEFKRFDYGREENLQRYGQEKPPMYDLSQVTAPVVLFYGDGDYISPPEVLPFCSL